MFLQIHGFAIASMVRKRPRLLLFVVLCNYAVPGEQLKFLGLFRIIMEVGLYNSEVPGKLLGLFRIFMDIHILDSVETYDYD